MIPLLKDYCRRYWWGFLVLLFAPMEALTEIPSFAGFSAILGPVTYIWQRQNGTLNVWRLLPLSQKVLTWTLWVCAVFLWPTLYLVAALVCRVFLGIVSGESPDLLAPLIFGWLAIAWAGLAMVVAVGVPTDTADIKTTRDHVQAQIFGGLWGLCMGLGMSGPLFLMPTILAHPLIALALGLLILALSVFVVHGYIMPVRGGHAVKTTAPARETGHRLYRRGGAGIGATVAQVFLSTLGLGVLSLAVLLIIGRIAPAEGSSAARFAPAGLVVYLSLPLLACYPWPPALRALRTLPLRSATLTLSLLLSSVAIGITVMTTIAVIAAYIWHLPFTSFLPQVVLLGGLSIAILAIGMHFGVWALMVCLWIGIGAWPLLQLQALPASGTLFLAFLLATCGGLAVHHLLRHSSKVYRQRWTPFGPKNTRS